MTRNGQWQTPPFIQRPTGPPVDEADDGPLLDRVPRVSSPGLFFLSAGIVTFFGIFVVGRVRTEPAPENVLLCLLFGVLCLGLLKTLLQSIVGRERLRLDSRGLEYCWSFGLTALAEVDSA